MDIINTQNTYRQLSHFGDKLFLFFKDNQKKIMIVAIIALGWLAACYLSIKYLKNKKIEQRKREENKPEILHLLDKLIKDKRILIPQNSLNKSALESVVGNDLLVNCFTFLEKKDWKNLSSTNCLFYFLSQKPIVIGSLLEKHYFSLDQAQKLAKIATSHFSILKLRYPTGLNVPEAIQQLLIDHPHIAKLYLDHVYVTDQTLAYLPPNLQSLSLNLCNEITNAALANLPPNLQFLTLSWYSSDVDLTHLPPNLQSLCLIRCIGLTDAALAKLPSNLQFLDLVGCSELTDAVLAKLPSNLQSLNLFYSFQFTDAGLAKLPSSLRSLDLSSCAQLTDAALVDLPPSLQSLCVRRTKFSTDALDRLRSRLCNLKVII